MHSFHEGLNLWQTQPIWSQVNILFSEYILAPLIKNKFTSVGTSALSQVSVSFFKKIIFIIIIWIHCSLGWKKST